MPWLNGERSPVEDKIMRAGWLNLSLRTDRAMLVRSVLEGVAYNSRWLFDAYEKFLKRSGPQGAHPRRRRAERPVVPDLRRRPGAPVEQVADPRHAQLRGVALWARVCLGELTFDDVPAFAPAAATFLPSIHAQAYADGYAEYRKLYGKLKGLYHRLNAGGAVDGRAG